MAYDFPTVAKALDEMPFDEVEVVGFGASGPSFHSGFGGGFCAAWSSPLEESDRILFRTLVNALPRGESARCHMPPFGVRIRGGGREVCISVCFACSNAYVDGELAAFNAQSREAQALLAFLRSRAPSGWTSSE